MTPTTLAALAAIAMILAWALVRGSARRLPSARSPFRTSTVARLTVIYMDRDDNWRGTYAYFEAPDFAGCRIKAAEWLRAYARGEAVADMYRTWPSTLRPRELTGADLADEFRSVSGESTNYAFQPQEWVL